MRKQEPMILAAAGAAMNEAAQIVTPRKSAPAITDSRCVACGKPTRSHRLNVLVICHACYTRLTAEQLDILDNIMQLSRLEKLKDIAEKSCRQKLLVALNQWKNSGVLYCTEHDHILNETGDNCPGCIAEWDYQEAMNGAAAAQTEAEAEAEAMARDREEHHANQEENPYE